MRMFLVAVAFVVVCPGVAFAQLAPQSQAEFEQRFTGWTLQFDAPDCNEGDGIDPVTFIDPGRFDTAGFEGDYEYQGTGANTGTLTLRADILPTPQALDLTFNSQTMGTFTARVFGSRCGGRFEFADPTADTTPPSLVSAVVENSGDAISLTFNEYIDSSSLPFPLHFAISVTADDEPVEFSSFASGATGATITLREFTPTITPGQSVVVSYTDPTPGDDEEAIQDAAGNDAVSFTVTATNNSTTTTDTTPPALVSVVVEDTGNQITLTFDEDVRITRNPVDFFDDPFSITADGQPVSRNARVTSGNLLSFAGISPVITSGQTVTVSYVDPTPGDDEHGLHDRAGNDAASFTRNAVNNSIIQPTPVLPLAGVGLLGLLLAGLGGWLSRSR